MRLRVLYAVGVSSFAIIFTACNLVHTRGNSQSPAKAPTIASTPYPDGSRRVTIAELETLMKEGKVFVVDVRNQDSYDAGHIPGAKLIPSGEILNHLKELPRDKIIVTYCS